MQSQNCTTKLTQRWSDHEFDSSDDEDLASVVRDEGFGVNPTPTLDGVSDLPLR